MKKFMIISLLLMVSLTVLIVILPNPEEEKINDQNVVKVLNEDEISKYFDNKEDFIFVMGKSTCGPCNNYKENTLPIYLKDDNDLPLYFAYSDQSFESRSALKSFISRYNITYQASPTTYIVKNGEVVAKYEGYQTIDKLYNFISKYK